jgi:phytoene dehydrogenase-like protein
MVLGDRHHGSYHPDNFDANRPHPSLSNYRTPIAGLYHCGSDSYPGGSFTGQPAYNAATAIARDLGYEIWWNPKHPHEVLPEV